MGNKYIDIIYEDRDVLVVNKPRGLVVVPEKAKGDTGGKNLNVQSLVNNVRAYLMRKFPEAGGVFVKPAHRLDKETTGLVLFAKSKAGMKLVEEIKTHRVKRVYAAIVEGAIENEDGTIKKTLIKGDFGHGKKVGVASIGEGKETITNYHVIERYENATWAEVRLETGFTHQIRVHLASIGHPLVGDKVYNPHSVIKFPRQALHAIGLTFSQPSTGKKVQLKCPFPKDMEDLIDRLRG